MGFHFQKKDLKWLIPLTLLLLCLPLLVPSAVAEELPDWLKEADLPVYEPVELENPDAEPLPLGDKAVYKPRADGFLPDNAGYLDSTLSVRIESRVIKDTRMQFTWIRIADPSQMRCAPYRSFTSDSRAKATMISRKVQGAVVAINGDWPASKEKRKHGLVVRNGDLIRTKDCERYDSLSIDMAGDFHIIRHAAEADYAAYEGNILHSFVFGPALVIDGEKVTVDRKKKMEDAMIRHCEGWHGAQRNVLCQMGPLSYLIITSEGPEQKKGTGLSIDEMSWLTYAIGAKQAFNLDGGSSTWLVLNDERINTMKTKNFRIVQDILYFATAEPS